MLVTVDGIIIGMRGAGESGGYLDILTNEFGVIEVVAHGMKKLNSKNAGSTSMFSYATFCLSKSGLKYTINSTSPKFSFHQLSEDIVSLSAAAYFAEIIKYTSAAEQKSDSGESELRLMIVSLYELIQKRIPERLIKAVFELKLCVLLGLMPDLVACADCFCYENNSFYFLPDDGIIICDDCFSDVYGFKERLVFCLPPELLHLMRYIVYTPVNKVFKINVKDSLLDEISVIAENYVLEQLGRGFKTLDYYKKIIFF